jgi:hypothetical protein
MLGRRAAGATLLAVGFTLVALVSALSLAHVLNVEHGIGAILLNCSAPFVAFGIVTLLRYRITVAALGHPDSRIGRLGRRWLADDDDNEVRDLLDGAADAPSDDVLPPQPTRRSN